MSTVELREKVLKKLESVDDYLLKEVLNLIEFETNDSVYKLSDAQKSSVDESRKQIKEGNTYTNEEVDKEIDAWLNE
jgi:predicted transcriptional regulator